MAISRRPCRCGRTRPRARKLSPNPLYVELQAAPTPAPGEEKPAAKKKKPATAAAQPSRQPAPAPGNRCVSAAARDATEPTSSANYPWPTTR